MTAKHILSQKRRCCTRFRKTVITNAVLTQNAPMRNLKQKRRFGFRFRDKVISNPVLTQNEAKRNLHQKYVW